MKFLKKRPVAIGIMVLAIVLSIGIGWFRHEYGTSLLRPSGLELDESLDTAYYSQFIYDQADVLGSSAEKKLALYNANWDARYNSITAFVSVENVNVDAEEYADGMFSDFRLEAGDALLLVVKSGDQYRFVFGNDFAGIINAKVQDQLASAMDGGSWEGDALNFYAALNDVLTANFGEGNGTGATHESGGGVSAVPAFVTVVLFIIVLVLCLSAIDRSRYNTYRARYYGVANPPVVFRPIFFWHGPGTAWYRRGWHRPPPPPPSGPRGPGGFGGPGPGGFGGSRPSGGSRPTGNPGGFGGAGARGPRGTGFSGGGSFGGTRGSGPRPGSFGGSSFGSGRSGGFGGGSFGGSRGGGFGGSRGGSFGGSRGGGFGGSRGGGFGGSRGGGFGGRR